MAPPEPLVRTLVEGPSPVAALEWHDVIGSTNSRALELAAQGAPEITVVVADEQTAGRGRTGTWVAPPGTSLLLSLLLRPPVPPAQLGLLPLLTGLALADTAQRALPGAEVAVKWPNDLLARPASGGAWRKAAGILVEGVVGGAAVVGIGLNVDWRGVDRPEGLLHPVTSLAEVAGHDVDRWRLLAALLGVFGNRYAAWCGAPGAFLDAYRERCVTIGLPVRASRPGRPPLEGRAVAIAASGGLRVEGPDGEVVEVTAGDVTHLRPA